MEHWLVSRLSSSTLLRAIVDGIGIILQKALNEDLIAVARAV